MFIGRLTYILGMIFTFFSFIAIIMMFFLGEMDVMPFFGLLNGLIAMGVGEVVIDLNFRNGQKERNK